VAVTVKHAPFVTLDTADRIVGVGPHVESRFGPLVGSVMCDCFPGSEPLFKPCYDKARETRSRTPTPPLSWVSKHGVDDRPVGRLQADLPTRGQRSARRTRFPQRSHRW
jgi:hypothetical protein